MSFLLLCRAYGLPTPVPEHRFYPPRMWRFDFAFLEHKVAVEQEGAIFTAGRHVRGVGVLKDMEKYNRAAAEGWRVFRATPQQIAAGEILPLLAEVIGAMK